MGISRNAICGKSWREGIAWGRIANRDVIRPKRIRRKRIKPMVPAIVVEPIEPGPTGESTLDGCQWLHGEAVERNFCWAPVMFNRSWCPYHYGVVFNIPGTVRSGRGQIPSREPRTFPGRLPANPRAGLG